MNVYIYQADLHCEKCAKRIGFVCHTESHRPKGTNLCDSECTPIGPYANGGGESDTPQHCGTCGVFLENDLTSDGEDYVRKAIKDGQGACIEEWREFYSYLF